MVYSLMRIEIELLFLYFFIVKTQISNILRMTHFWKNIHQVR
jgi:hypothetical protein